MLEKSKIFVITYLLDFLLISFLKASDIPSPFLGLLNLSPCLHFLLFQKSNTIGQQLGITINTLVDKKKLEIYLKMMKNTVVNMNPDISDDQTL